MSEKQWYVKYASLEKISGPKTELEAVSDCSRDAADAIMFTMEMLTQNWHPAFIQSLDIIKLSMKFAQECLAGQKEAELKLEEMNMRSSDSEVVKELQDFASSKYWDVEYDSIRKTIGQAVNMIESFSREKSKSYASLHGPKELARELRGIADAQLIIRGGAKDSIGDVLIKSAEYLEMI